MKYIAPLLIAICTLSSCTGWDSESKESFLHSCVNDAKANGKDDAAAKSMCDCRLEKIMKKYPNVDDALAHMDSIVKDPDVAACK